MCDESPRYALLNVPDPRRRGSSEAPGSLDELHALWESDETGGPAAVMTLLDCGTFPAWMPEGCLELCRIEGPEASVDLMVSVLLAEEALCSECQRRREAGALARLRTLMGEVAASPAQVEFRRSTVPVLAWAADRVDADTTISGERVRRLFEVALAPGRALASGGPGWGAYSEGVTQQLVFASAGPELWGLAAAAGLVCLDWLPESLPLPVAEAIVANLPQFDGMPTGYGVPGRRLLAAGVDEVMAVRRAVPPNMFPKPGYAFGVWDSARSDPRYVNEWPAVRGALFVSDLSVEEVGVALRLRGGGFVGTAEELMVAAQAVAAPAAA